jgi:hypothetical protein
MNVYNINPNKSAAKHARERQSDRIRKSINYLINECSDKLNFRDKRIDLALSKISKVNRLLPEIHYLHHLLQAAMRLQDPIQVRTSLLKLIDAICTDPDENEWISISSLSDSEWEKFIVIEAKRLTNQDLGKEAKIEPILGSELTLATNILNAALTMIARYDPDMFDEIQEQVRVIKLFRGKVTRGLTDVRILGAMLIRSPHEAVNPLLYFLEHVIHEASHIHLNCLMSIDPLILNSSSERFISPLRPDPRPMVGVFHATYVSARISRTFMTLYRLTENKDFLHTLAETLDETIRGISEIRKHAKLTVHGCELVDSMTELVESARKLPEWKAYKFEELRDHRFGFGKTKVTDFQRAVA